MKTYTIQKCSATPDWRVLPKLAIDHAHLDPDTGIRAFAQIGWNEEALHVHLWAEETQIRAQETGPLGMPCEDSCLEFFFCTMEDELRYLNLEFNPNGCLYLGLGSGIRDLVRLVPEETVQELFDPRIARTEDGWEITYRIPVSFVRRFFPGFALKAGKTLRANCYKCGDSTEKCHYFAWSPITAQKFTFHTPENFGLMELV